MSTALLVGTYILAMAPAMAIGIQAGRIRRRNSAIAAANETMIYGLMLALLSLTSFVSFGFTTVAADLHGTERSLGFVTVTVMLISAIWTIQGLAAILAGAVVKYAKSAPRE